MYVCLMSKDDREYKFICKYAERIVDAFKKVKAMANFRDQSKILLRVIKKQIINENLHKQNLCQELAVEFNLVDKRDEEVYVEKEFNPESLAFRYYNLLNNYDTLKGVSKLSNICT